jgi:hypothetical protein
MWNTLAQIFVSSKSAIAVAWRWREDAVLVVMDLSRSRSLAGHNAHPDRGTCSVFVLYCVWGISSWTAM